MMKSNGESNTILGVLTTLPITEIEIMARLTKRQQSTLKKHSVHHSKKHMSEMRKAMREGSTFTAAHKRAMKKVGK